MVFEKKLAATKLKTVFFYFLYSDDDKRHKYKRYISGSTVELVGDDVFVHYKGHLIIKAFYQGINEVDGKKHYNVMVRLKDRPVIDRVFAIINALDWFDTINFKVGDGSVKIIDANGAERRIDRHQFYSKSDFAALMA